MKRVVSILLVLVMGMALLSLTACGDGNVSKGYEVTSEKTNYVLMTVKGYGKILIELDPSAAPITVENFQRLVSESFYDGLTFHRVMSGFMIQGGDPKGDGTGGSDENITGEFETNGIPNPLKHTRGVISMARAKDPNSASSQFFIMHADRSSLDGNYAAFGRVIDGMKTVDAIAECEVTYNFSSYPPDRSVPIEKVVIEKVVFVRLK